MIRVMLVQSRVLSCVIARKHPWGADADAVAILLLFYNTKKAITRFVYGLSLSFAMNVSRLQLRQRRSCLAPRNGTRGG